MDRPVFNVYWKTECTAIIEIFWYLMTQANRPFLEKELEKKIEEMELFANYKSIKEWAQPEFTFARELQIFQLDNAELSCVQQL